MCNGISEKASTGCAEAFRTSVATGSMRYLSASQVWSRERTAGYENGKCNLYIPGVAKGDWPKYEDHYEAGGTPYSTRICATGGFYPRAHPKFAEPVKASIPFDDLPLGAKTICVTPLDSFGNGGAAIVADILGD